MENSRCVSGEPRSRRGGHPAAAARTDSRRLAFDRILLKTPILGSFIRKSAVSRFTRTLGTLNSSGVSILEGLEITARTEGNQVVHEAVM